MTDLKRFIPLPLIAVAVFGCGGDEAEDVPQTLAPGFYLGEASGTTPAGIQGSVSGAFRGPAVATIQADGGVRVECYPSNSTNYRVVSNPAASGSLEGDREAEFVYPSSDTDGTLTTSRGQSVSFRFIPNTGATASLSAGVRRTTVPSLGDKFLQRSGTYSGSIFLTTGPGLGPAVGQPLRGGVVTAQITSGGSFTGSIRLTSGTGTLTFSAGSNGSGTNAAYVEPGFQAEVNNLRWSNDGSRLIVEFDDAIISGAHAVLVLRRS